MLRIFKTWLQRWLFPNLTTMEKDLHKLKEDIKTIVKEVKRVEDSAILGVDLGYRDLSEIIIIKYSKINNSFKVVADATSQFKYYNDFVRHLRSVCSQYNVEIIALDTPNNIPSEILRAKILPDQRLVDYYSELM